MDQAGRDAVEVPHQPQVVDVALADVAQRERRGMRARERQREVREAAVHRVAADVDEPRLRKNTPQEQHVAPVVRQLVDEERAVGLAVQGRAAKIVLSHRRGLLAAQPGDQLRHGGVAAARRQLHRRAQDRGRVSQLARRLDRGMAAEHLLEQRRARARQADHEDRRRLADRLAVERLDECRVDRALDLVDLLGQLAGVVAQAFRALAVGFGIVREGFGMLTAIVQRARQREVQRRAVAHVDRDADAFAYLREILVGQHLLLDAGETPPGIAELEIGGGRLAVGGDRVVDPPDGAQAVAVGDPVRRHFRVRLDEPLLQRHRLVVPAELAQDVRTQRRDRRIVALALEQLEQGARLVEPLLLVDHRGQRAPGFEIAIAAGERAAEEMLGLAERPEQHGDAAEQGEAARLLGMAAQMGHRRLRGALELAVEHQPAGFAQQRIARDRAGDGHA